MTSTNHSLYGQNSKPELFTKTGCPQCKQTKAWLDQHGIPYAEYDISTYNGAFFYVVNVLGMRAAPVVCYNGETWSGFNKEKLEWLSRSFAH